MLAVRFAPDEAKSTTQLIAEAATAEGTLRWVGTCPARDALLKLKLLLTLPASARSACHRFQEEEEQRQARQPVGLELGGLADTMGFSWVNPMVLIFAPLAHPKP